MSWRASAFWFADAMFEPMASSTTTPTPAAARGARRRERTRVAVLDAAERLLSERAPDEIRIEEVAVEAGISPASVYVHFGTKEGLVAAVVERLIAIAVDSLMSAYTVEGTAFDQVLASGRAYIRLLVEHPALTRYLVVNGLREPESDMERLVADKVALLRAEFETRIEAAVEAGEMTQPLDSRLTSYYLFGAWNGVAALALRKDGSKLEPDEVEAAVLGGMDVMVAGATRQGRAGGAAPALAPEAG